MEVRCIADLPDGNVADTLVAAKLFFPGRQVYGVKVGQEYLVYGMQFWRNIPYVFVLTSTDVAIHLSAVPLSLFEISNNRVSRFWNVRHWPDGDVTMWPPLLYQDFLTEDLYDGKREVVEAFQRLRRVMEAEAEVDFM
jgi:hypothetical protein